MTLTVRCVTQCLSGQAWDWAMLLSAAVAGGIGWENERTCRPLPWCRLSSPPCTVRQLSQHGDPYRWGGRLGSLIQLAFCHYSLECRGNIQVDELLHQLIFPDTCQNPVLNPNFLTFFTVCLADVDLLLYILQMHKKVVKGLTLSLLAASESRMAQGLVI